MRIKSFVLLCFLLPFLAFAGGLCDLGYYFGLTIGCKVNEIVDEEAIPAAKSSGPIVSYECAGIKLLHGHSWSGLSVCGLYAHAQTQRIVGYLATTKPFADGTGLNQLLADVKSARKLKEECVNAIGSGLAFECAGFAPFDSDESRSASIEMGRAIPGAVSVYGYSATSLDGHSLRVVFVVTSDAGIVRLVMVVMDVSYAAGLDKQPQNWSEYAEKFHAIPSDVYGKVKDSLAILETSGGRGSGFVAQVDGKAYLYTNKHVIREAYPLVAKTIDGRLLLTGDLEIAENRDLARFEMLGHNDGIVFENETPSIGVPLVIFGNSGGAGLVTEIKGVVQGIGPTSIETDAEFIPGNSGSPMINSKGRVIGIATFLYKENRTTGKWVTDGTRFADVRRFGVRTLQIEWKRIDHRKYVEGYQSLASIQALILMADRLAFPSGQAVELGRIKDFNDKLCADVGVTARQVKYLHEVVDAYNDLQVCLVNRIQKEVAFRKALGGFDEPEGWSSFAKMCDGRLIRLYKKTGWDYKGLKGYLDRQKPGRKARLLELKSAYVIAQRNLDESWQNYEMELKRFVKRIEDGLSSQNVSVQEYVKYKEDIEKSFHEFQSRMSTNRQVPASLGRDEESRR